MSDEKKKRAEADYFINRGVPPGSASDKRDPDLKPCPNCGYDKPVRGVDEASRFPCVKCPKCTFTHVRIEGAEAARVSWNQLDPAEVKRQVAAVEEKARRERKT